MVRTREFSEEGISYKTLLRMVEDGFLLRAKSGYYTIANESFRDEEILCSIYPDCVLTMESALFFHGYIPQKPSEWQLAVSKNTSKSRFRNPPIAIEPYYTEERVLSIGAEEKVISKETMTKDDRESNDAKWNKDCPKEGFGDQSKTFSLQIYGIDRLICDVLKYEEKLSREVFKAAVRAYIDDENKDVGKLLLYAKERKVLKKVQGIIGVWL